MATTVSLVAVFVPIAFLTGMVGRLFAELALAVAGAVLISGFVALTLTPMMCGTLLKSGANRTWLRHAAEHVFTALQMLYRRMLVRALQATSLVVSMGVGAVAASLLLVIHLPAELAPLEDV